MDFGPSTALWPSLWLVVAVLVALVARRRLLDATLPAAVVVGALVAAGVGLLDGALLVQAVVFAVVVVGWIGVGWRWRALLADDRLPVGVGGNRLVGMRGEVVEPIAPHRDDRGGHVRIEGETWTAFTTADVVVPTGAVVSVLAVEGTRLRVSTPVDAPVASAADVADVADVAGAAHAADAADATSGRATSHSSLPTDPPPTPGAH